MHKSTHPELVCGPERRSTKRGMTNVERFCTIGWDVDDAGCWIWRGELYKGRARIALASGSVKVARMIWEELYGPIEPKELHVRHKCDQAACVNPDHLELGTAEQNREDARSRGRRPALSPDRARRARELFESGLMTQAELARAFNVTVWVMRDVLDKRGAYRDKITAPRKAA